MSSAWDWIGQFTDAALREGDDAKLRLCMFSVWAEQIPPSDPAAKLAMFAQGTALARQLNEPWWEMFYTHWEIEVLLHKQARPQDALALAARANVEIRKPVYDRFPQRSAIKLNLISCYLSLDPIGYEAPLREAFEPLKPSAKSGASFVVTTRSSGAIFSTTSRTRTLWTRRGSICVWRKSTRRRGI